MGETSPHENVVLILKEVASLETNFMSVYWHCQ